jgi:hypothetical protein
VYDESDHGLLTFGASRSANALVHVRDGKVDAKGRETAGGGVKLSERLSLAPRIHSNHAYLIDTTSSCINTHANSCRRQVVLSVNPHLQIHSPHRIRGVDSSYYSEMASNYTPDERSKGVRLNKRSMSIPIL